MTNFAAFLITLSHQEYMDSESLSTIPGVRMSARWIVAVFVSSLLISLALATEPTGSEPSGDFLMSRLAVKTETDSLDLSMRLIEFVNGIRTSKKWERASDSSWRLTTEFTDPVISEKRRYTLTFEKSNGLVLLSRIAFNGQVLSYQELQDFAKRIIRNYEQHFTIPK